MKFRMELFVALVQLQGLPGMQHASNHRPTKEKKNRAAESREQSQKRESDEERRVTSPREAKWVRVCFSDWPSWLLFPRGALSVLSLCSECCCGGPQLRMDIGRMHGVISKSLIHIIAIMFGGNDQDDDDQDIWGSLFGKKKTNNPIQNAFGGKKEGSFPTLMGIFALA